MGASVFADAIGEATISLPMQKFPAGAHPVDVTSEVDRNGEIVAVHTSVTVDRPAIKPSLQVLEALDVTNSDPIACRGNLCPPLGLKPPNTGKFRLLVEAPIGCEIDINGEKGAPKPSTSVIWHGRSYAEIPVDPRPRALALPLPDALKEGTFALVIPGHVSCDGETLDATLELGPRHIGLLLREALSDIRNGALTFGDDDNQASAKPQTLLFVDAYGRAQYFGPQGSARRVDLVVLCDGSSFTAWNRRTGKAIAHDYCGSDDFTLPSIKKLLP
jgi:hypothetical protein